MAAQVERLGDHTAYVQARWAVLVRSLVAEGVDVASAETVVARVLARLRPGWERLARDEDADVRVWADVRADAGLRADHGAVAPVLDDPDLVQRTADVTVSPQPLVLIEEQARRHRRSVLRGLALAALALVIVGGYLAWATTRPAAPDVDDVTNPAPVPWYAGGRLHLAEASVRLPDVDLFVVRGADEVLYADSSGQWHIVTGDGLVEEAPVPVDAGLLEDGMLFSPDQRYVVRVAAGGALVYDTELKRTVDNGLGSGVRVLDARFAADGTVTYVVSNQVETRQQDSTVRLSETGTLGLRTCVLVTAECREVVRVSGSTGSLRLR